MTLSVTDRFLTWEYGRKTLPGNCVYEVTFKHPKSEWNTHDGYSIRYLEEEDSEEGKSRAVGCALEDIFRYFPPEGVILPESFEVSRHPGGWEKIEENRKLREIKAAIEKEEKRQKREKKERITWQSLTSLRLN